MKTTDMLVIQCWPNKWLEAAQHAGLAIYKDGKWNFISEGIQHSLAEFAKYIIENEREECAKICESAAMEWPDNPEYGSYGEFDKCAKLIRLRSK